MIRLLKQKKVLPLQQATYLPTAEVKANQQLRADMALSCMKLNTMQRCAFIAKQPLLYILATISLCLMLGFVGGLEG